MLKKYLVACLLTLLLTAPWAHAGTETNARWFLNTVFPNWSCAQDVAAYCKASELKDYAFGSIYPAEDQAGSNVFFVINDWSGTSGPGSGTMGDTPTLWQVDDSYNGLRGVNGPFYLGDLSPNVGGHWHGFNLVRFGSQDWVVLIEHADGASDPQPTHMYYRRGSPYNFRGNATDGQPGPTETDFYQGLLAETGKVWEVTDPCDIRLNGLTYIGDGGSRAYGFITWAKREGPVIVDETGDEKCSGYCVDGLCNRTDHLIIDFDQQQFKLGGVWWSFGTDLSSLPVSGNPSILSYLEPGQYQGSWELVRHGGSIYAMRARTIGVAPSPYEVPPSCANTSIYDQNMTSAPLVDIGGTLYPYQQTNLETWEYAPVDPYNDWVGSWTNMAGASNWTPGEYNAALNFAAGYGGSAGTFMYRSTATLAICRQSPLHTWNPQSGSSILVMDFTP